MSSPHLNIRDWHCHVNNHVLSLCNDRRLAVSSLVLREADVGALISSLHEQPGYPTRETKENKTNSVPCFILFVWFCCDKRSNHRQQTHCQRCQWCLTECNTKVTKISTRQKLCLTYKRIYVSECVSSYYYLLLLFVSEIWLAGRHGGIFFRPDRSVKLWKKPLGALRDTVSRVCESRWGFVVLFIVRCFGLWVVQWANVLSTTPVWDSYREEWTLRGHSPVVSFCLPPDESANVTHWV